MRDGTASVRVLGTRVDLVDAPGAARRVADWARQGCGRMVCATNVHMVMEAWDDARFAAVVNAADLVVADGRPVAAACRLLGHPHAPHVRGYDLMMHVCAQAAREGISVGLYGGLPESVLQVRERLCREYPGLRITFAKSPPFRPLTPDEDAADVGAILAAGVQVLFVALGCPKQERWMAAHRAALPCTSIGVGAAFDMVSGRYRPAPRWMQRAGLEWLFRLSQEPRRLWSRYLRHNSRFLLYFAAQWARTRRAA
jgi:N-acetylglucosaminyldiphosphoundecaprenol N-acetyl-beta-D-mannosaminyltransferase